MGKTTIPIMCLTGALVLAASCNKIEDKPVAHERTVITAVAEAVGGGTKAHNQYSYDVLWDTGDKIYVTGEGKSNTFTVSNESAGTKKGVFTEDTPSYGITGAIEAFYPASLKTDDGYVWPASQSNNQVAPMYAKQRITGTANEVVNFSSLGAMLQIVFSTKTEDITVTSITLQSNKKPLSGKFTVTDGLAIMAENSENPGVTLDLGKSGVPVGVAAKYFYIAIPAGTYSNEAKDEVMTITFTDDVHHKECVMTSTTFPTVNRNTVGRITLAKDFTDQKFTVKFDMKGHGEAIQDAKVELNQKVTAPSTPKAANYAFWCWCTDTECTTPYDFSKAVTEDLTLYAKWTEGINGHAYVELAGKKWATENVGYCENVNAVAGPSKKGNGWGFYFYKQEENDALNAAKSWDSESNHEWTLPNDDQWKALIENCYWEWTNSYNYPTSPYNGKPGYIVYRAKSDADKNQLNKENSGYAPATDTHLFLPAAGVCNGLEGVDMVRDQGYYGYFWSSDDRRCLIFDDGFRYLNLFISNCGCTVRPVSE